MLCYAKGSPRKTIFSKIMKGTCPYLRESKEDVQTVCSTLENNK
jgi:hypothetical protein